MKKLIYIFLMITAFSLSLYAQIFKVDGINYGVTSQNTVAVARQGFFEYYPKNIVIPQNVTYNEATYDVIAIGDNAFSDLGQVETVTIPESIVSIGKNAFSFCSNLKTLTIPKSVTFIASGAFHSAGLTSLIVDEGNPSYFCSDNVLYSKNGDTLICYLTNKREEFAIPDNIRIIADYAFIGTQLTSIMIPNKVTSIGDYAFEYSNLKGIIIPNSVTSIGKHAFAGSNLKTLTLSKTLKSINEYVFERCDSLTSVEIPNGVNTIGHGAFYRCQSLLSVTIPSSVDSIGDFAFNSSSKLSYMKVLAKKPPTIDLYTFDESQKATPIYIPKGCFEAYVYAEYWRKFTNIIELPSYTLSLAVNDNAMGIVEGGGDYDENEEVEIKAIANIGYIFEKWNDGDTNAIRTIIITSDTSFTANFIKKSSLNDVKELSNPMKLYPNPTSTKVNILLNNFKSNTKLSVLDIQGRVIKTQTINSKETKLDVSSFAKGVYFVRIDNSVQKLIIE